MINEDRFTLNKNVLKEERKFIRDLIKLCEKHRMVFYAGGVHSSHNKIRIYDWVLESMRDLE